MIIQIIILFFGVFALSTAVVFIKFSKLDPILLASYRQLFAALILTPFFIKALREKSVSIGKLIKPAILPGIALGAHFITWIIGARMTTAANATIIVNLVPISMPFFIFFSTKEIPSINEWLGTLISIGGVLFISLGELDISQKNSLGNLICLGSMLLFTFYLTLAKHNRHSIWLYIVPLYYIGGIFCLLISLFFTSPLAGFNFKEFLWILGLGMIPTIIGHTIINKSMMILKSQLVSLVNLFQFVSATLMGYHFFHEIPHPNFYLGAILIITGASLVIIFTKKKSY
jgi:drug/metabolite transporter (DMT)-like permease